MKTIYYKNGTTQQIPIFVANLLRDKIVSDNPKFQCISDKGNDLLMIVNVEEIVCIY